LRDVEQIVGREAEIESLERFVTAVDALPGALVIDGAAGIGKSTMLEAGAARAREGSCGVLRCGPGDRESRLSFAALRDLLEGVYEETAAQLPAPQRRALAIALLREEPGVPLDRGAVSAAFLTLLRERSRAGPILLVIDDVQWLDRPTATAVAFAARRFRQEPIGILIAHRSDAGGAAPLGLDRALAPGRLHRLTLGPLSLGALQAMLRARFDRPFPRPVLRRIHEASGGNPLFALEIAMALDDDEASGPGTALPIPRDVRELLRARIESLPADTRAALLVASASSAPTLELVAATTEIGAGSNGVLDAAERAGVIEIQSEQIRFTHPLLASTVYTTASPTDRRGAHRALAGCATDPEERARHLALSSDRPDPAIAAALDDAARIARTRAAPDSAAELADLARLLTPPEDTQDIVRRGVEAAGHHFDAGNAVRAQELFVEMAAAAPPGPARAEILWRLANASWNETDLVRGYLERGLEVASGDLRLECGIRWDLAWTWVYGGDLAEAEREARRSLAIAERLDDASLMPEALAAVGICEFLLGRDGGERIARAASLQESGSIPDTYTTPRLTLALRHLWAGELDAARSTLEPVLDHLAKQGLYTLATEPFELLGEIECRAGRYGPASRHAATAIEVKLGAGFEDMGGLTLYPQALVDACRGEVESARGYAAQGLAWSERRGDHFYANCHRAVLGFVELSLARSAEADQHFQPVLGFLREMGVREPGVIPVLADAIEARIGMGDLDRADELLMEFDAQGRASGRPWALATAARGRGLLLAARGEAAAASPVFERALEEHRRVAQPLELGRTLLAKGEVERRAKQKSAARESVGGALAIFEDLGARIWAERARAELARTGGRSTASDALTPTERRIAELVAQGSSNKEVAAAAFVSVKTVEANLSRIYAKLGVRSRAALAHRFAEEHRREQAEGPQAGS
jgi:DNA-binding CsgD family transcriptional regulator